jgi:hypothetical protein
VLCPHFLKERKGRKKFKLFWLRGDSAFADPDIYEYCEANRIKECDCISRCKAHGSGHPGRIARSSIKWPGKSGYFTDRVIGADIHELCGNTLPPYLLSAMGQKQRNSLNGIYQATAKGDTNDKGDIS